MSARSFLLTELSYNFRRLWILCTFLSFCSHVVLFSLLELGSQNDQLLCSTEGKSNSSETTWSWVNDDRSKILGEILLSIWSFRGGTIPWSGSWRITVWRLAYLLTQPCCRMWDYAPKSVVMHLLGINLQGTHFPFIIVAFSALGWQSHEMLTRTEWEGKCWILL